MMNIHSKMFQRIKDSRYRNLFIKGQIKTGIPFQVRALRAARELTQGELAEKAKTKQSVISRIENRSERNLSIKTLLNLAEAFDVALVVRFEPIDKLANWVDDLSPETMSPKPSEEILADIEREALEQEAINKRLAAIKDTAQLTATHSLRPVFPATTSAIQQTLVFDRPHEVSGNAQTQAVTSAAQMSNSIYNRTQGHQAVKPTKRRNLNVRRGRKKAA